MTLLNRHDTVFDANLEFKDAGLVAASAAAEVDSVAKIVDLGVGYFEGRMVIDATAVEVDSGNEIFTIGVQLSSSATFASTIKEVASLKLGDAAALPGDVDMVEGRYILYFNNEVNGTQYRYARLYTTVAGTIATGINYKAFCTKMS